MRHTYPEFHAVESVETQVVGDPNLTGNPHLDLLKMMFSNFTGTSIIWGICIYIYISLYYIIYNTIYIYTHIYIYMIIYVGNTLG